MDDPLKCIYDKNSKSAASSQDCAGVPFSKLVSNIAKSIQIFYEFFQNIEKLKI